MLCSYPIVRGPEKIHGCGQCLSCRVNQSRKWALRVVLEQRISVQTFFVTLTYDEEHVPYRLSKRHVQLWLKQMRNYGYKFRYYACGEYGSKTRRPHYHAMLYFKSRPNLDILRVDIARAWTRGFSSVRSVDGGATARYVSKYVTKKATIEWDAQKPEWHLSSRSPGLGYEGVAAICESLLHYKYFHQCDDVPGEMEVDGKKYPIDSYLKKHMRLYMEKEYGLVCDTRTAARRTAERLEELFIDYKNARMAGEKLGSVHPEYGIYADFSRPITDKYANKRARFVKSITSRQTQL